MVVGLYILPDCYVLNTGDVWITDRCLFRVWLLTAPGDPDHTGPHRARTRPEMTDYFIGRLLRVELRRNSEPTVLGLQLNKQETLNTSVTN